MPNCATEFPKAPALGNPKVFTVGNNVYLKIVAPGEHFGYKYGLYQCAGNFSGPPITTDGKS
jgi:hypothetical protein